MGYWQGGLVYFFYIHTTDSTQDHGKAIATLHSTCVSFWVQSAHQTQGRGQRGRIWSSKEGNLFLTGCLPPSRKISPGRLSITTGVSLLAILQSLLPKQQETLKLGLKWPNDVLLNQKKCAGILIEVSEYTFIGIGINIISHPDNTPMPATHLLADNSSINQNKLIMKIIETIPDFEKIENFEDVRKLWWEFAKESVPYWHVREPLNGKVLGIDEQGQLLILSENGDIIKRHQTFRE
jgi:BirA family biotin operon repressor/biotin-[acetyl-CoA-carboxylase] ligase